MLFGQSLWNAAMVHRDSVGSKDCCTNTNTLTYLLLATTTATAVTTTTTTTTATATATTIAGAFCNELLHFEAVNRQTLKEIICDWTLNVSYVIIRINLVRFTLRVSSLSSALSPALSNCCKPTLNLFHEAIWQNDNVAVLWLCLTNVGHI